VLNTCTVTASADQDARAAIRRIRRQNPGCQILVTGCYAQRAPEEIAALPGVARVIGNSHKHELVNIAVPASAVDLTADDERRVFVSDIFAHTELLAAPVFDAANERTRPNLKVQDGCDNRCSFCVIPFVRGQSRSLPLSQILREVRALVDAGYREVVISGINLGRWGRDLPNSLSSRPEWRHALSDPEKRSDEGESNGDLALHGRLRFEHLIRAILDETPLEKLRISSVEPMDWSDELIRLVADRPRIAKHVHVPMQSASDRILRLMHRKYRPWHYREKVETIRTAMPTAAIGADVMVGFPGETDADFDQTRAMIEALPFTYLHVFTYSARPGTPAASMRNQVPVQIARERNRVLRELAAKKRQAFMQSFVGGTVEAITLRSCVAPQGAPPKPVLLGWDSSAKNSRVAHPSRFCLGGVVPIPDPHASPVFTECLTDNYLKLHIEGSHEPNRWLQTRVERVEDGALVGRFGQLMKA